MRQVICDICGQITRIGVNPDCTSSSFITNQAGPMPKNWDTIIVRKSIKKDRVVDLCENCAEKFYSVQSGAQNTMDATVDAWILSMLNKKEDQDENKNR